MIIGQARQGTVLDILEKYFPEQDDLISNDDFGKRKIDTEKMKAKIQANIEGLSHVIQDIEVLETCRKKVYISGGITGVENYEEKFDLAERAFAEFDFDVVNPVKLGKQLEDEMLQCYKRKPTWYEYMRPCLTAMSDCYLVYMLKGWQKSTGARLEHNLAKIFNLKIMYES